jgi:hypothetical protein
LNKIQKANAVALFLFAVVTASYGIVDFTYVPELRSNSINLLGGFLGCAVLFYAAWSYLHDAHLDNIREEKLQSLEKRVEELSKEKSSRTLRILTQFCLRLLLRGYLFFERCYRSVFPMPL